MNGNNFPVARLSSLLALALVWLPSHALAGKNITAVPSMPAPAIPSPAMIKAGAPGMSPAAGVSGSLPSATKAAPIVASGDHILAEPTRAAGQPPSAMGGLSLLAVGDAPAARFYDNSADRNALTPSAVAASAVPMLSGLARPSFMSRGRAAAAAAVSLAALSAFSEPARAFTDQDGVGALTMGEPSTAEMLLGLGIFVALAASIPMIAAGVRARSKKMKMKFARTLATTGLAILGMSILSMGLPELAATMMGPFAAVIAGVIVGLGITPAVLFGNEG